MACEAVVSARIHTMLQLSVQSDILYIHTGSMLAHMQSVKMKNKLMFCGGVLAGLYLHIVPVKLL